MSTNPQGGGRDNGMLLLWPSPSQPPESIDNINPEELVSTIPKGRTTIDWTDGTVDIPNQPTKELNNKLAGTKHDYVRSIFVNADNHVYWWIPGEETGGYIDQFRGFDVPVAKAKKVVLFAFEPTTITVFAGTGSGSVTKTDSPQRSMERVTSNGDNKGVEITVDYTDSSDPTDWTLLKWTNEEDVLSKNPQPEGPLHTMNISQIGSVIRNTGGAEVAIAAEVKETIYEHFAADDTVGWAPLPGYTGPDLRTIPAKGGSSPNSKVFSWSNWGHHFIRFWVKSAEKGSTSTVAGSFLGKTG